MIEIISAMTIAGFAITTFFVGKYSGENDLEEKLVEDGHAEYYLDENNERQWRMKSPPKLPDAARNEPERD